MKKIRKLIVPASVLLMVLCGNCIAEGGWFAKKPKTALLVKDGRVNATIVIGKKAELPERFAAEELQKYFKLISGAEVKIAQKAKGNLIIIGTPESNKRLKKSAEKIEGLADDGFIIKTNRGNLILAAKNPRGVLYAVYTFLEEYLRVSWAQLAVDGQVLSPKDEVVPRKKTIEVSLIDVVWEPTFGFRGEQFTYPIPVSSIDWMAKYRMNTLLVYKFPTGRTYTKDAGYANELSPEM